VLASLLAASKEKGSIEEDIDGIPIAQTPRSIDEEDIDGVPIDAPLQTSNNAKLTARKIDEDIDGQPLALELNQPRKNSEKSVAELASNLACSQTSDEIDIEAIEALLEKQRLEAIAASAAEDAGKEKPKRRVRRRRTSQHEEKLPKTAEQRALEIEERALQGLRQRHPEAQLPEGTEKAHRRDDGHRSRRRNGDDETNHVRKSRSRRRRRKEEVPPLPPSNPAPPLPPSFKDKSSPAAAVAAATAASDFSAFLASRSRASAELPLAPMPSAPTVPLGLQPGPPPSTEVARERSRKRKRRRSKHRKRPRSFEPDPSLDGETLDSSDERFVGDEEREELEIEALRRRIIKRLIKTEGLAIDGNQVPLLS
jgi:hypothetical protein